MLPVFRSAPPPFSWSYSKLKNFEACPKKHYHVDLKKDFIEPEGDALQYGNKVHKVLEEALRDVSPKPLPDIYRGELQFAVDLVEGMRSRGAKTLVECQYAITTSFAPTEWFGRGLSPDKQPWFRAKTDALMLFGPVAVALDWKTGKVNEDSPQLALMAQCVFSHHPEVMKVRTQYVWMQHKAVTTHDFSRGDMAPFWESIMPRVRAYQRAITTSEFPARPSGLCKRHCPVRSCVHNGANQ